VKKSNLFRITGLLQFYPLITQRSVFINKGRRDGSE